MLFYYKPVFSTLSRPYHSCSKDDSALGLGFGRNSNKKAFKTQIILRQIYDEIKQGLSYFQRFLLKLTISVCWLLSLERNT